MNEYLDRFVNEIMPFATKAYHLSSEPSKMAFGGSSFGGICSLVMGMRYPGLFGALLVESPSLWLANEKFLRDDVAAYQGPWATRTFLAMGSKEYTFTRPKDPQPEFDKLLTTYIPKLVEILEGNGVTGPERMRSVVEEGAGHTESAWARRFPEALQFLASPWWKETAKGRENYLYFTSPKRPQASKPCALFVNKAQSHTLRGSPGGPIVSVGFNEWTAEGTQEVEMERADWLGLQGDW